MEVDRVKGILVQNLKEGLAGTDLQSASEVSKGMRCLRESIQKSIVRISLDQSIPYEQRGLISEAMGILYESIDETFKVHEATQSNPMTKFEPLER